MGEGGEIMTETGCIEKTNDLNCGVLKRNRAPIVLTWHHTKKTIPLTKFSSNGKKLSIRTSPSQQPALSTLELGN